MTTRRMIFPVNGTAARRMGLIPVNAMGRPVDPRLSFARRRKLGRPRMTGALVDGLGDYAHDFFNSPASRARLPGRAVFGIGAYEDDVMGYVPGALGMQAQVGTAKLYPELRTALDQVYKDKIATLPFVPKDWLTRVNQFQGTGTGLLLFPIRATNFLGFANSGLPTWVTQNADAWNMVADEAKGVIQKYMDGKIAEGRVAMSQFSSDETFWGQVRLAALRSAQIAVKVGEGTASLLAPKKTLLILAGIAVVGIIAWKNPRLFGHASA